MRLLYVIATYNRAEMLERLLDQIHAISPFPFSILIYDDGSNESYKKPLQKIRSQDVFIQARKNLGRKGYQEVTNTLFNLAETFEFDYLIKLDDDVELRQDSIEKAMDLIREDSVLNLWRDHRASIKVWTDIAPEFIDEDLMKIGWIDAGNWMATRSVMEALEWQCPPIEKYWFDHPDFSSSGVGKALSLRLKKLQIPIYLPRDSWIYHGRHKSKMNYDVPEQVRAICMERKPWKID